MKTIWTDIPVNLIQPLTQDSGEQVNQINLKMINRGQHLAILEDNSGEDWAMYRAMVALGAGLSDTELDRLTGPDFNTLCEHVNLAYGEGNQYWFDKLVWGGLSKSQRKTAEQDYNSPNKLPLLIPIDTVVHGQIDTIPLTIPTVGVMHAMHQLPEKDQETFITQHISGLDKTELDGLSVPDGKSLTLRVNDFLSKTGTHFSALTTSKP